MANHIVFIPELDADSATVAEILVKVGDTVSEGDPVAVLETDKASVEIEATASGKISEIFVAIDTEIHGGEQVVAIASATQTDATTADQQQAEPPAAAQAVAEQTEAAPTVEHYEQKTDDVGDEGADVAEVTIAVGDKVAKGDIIAVFETDKATVDIEAMVTGTVTSIAIQVGDKVQTNQLIATFETIATQQSAQPATTNEVSEISPQAATAPQSQQPTAVSPKPVAKDRTPQSDIYAGPYVRFLSRKLGVDLGLVAASGPRGRITAEDIYQFVNQQLSNPNQTVVNGLPDRPKQNYQKFGEVEVTALSKIQKVTIANMMRNWLNVPMVTQFDDADITDLEALRSALKPEMEQRQIKITPVAFLIKIIANTLAKHPKFNSAIDANLEHLITRKYINIGVAVATEHGLFVPVIKGVDTLDIWQIGQQLTELSKKARDNKLSLKEMSGSCFTLSSLGAIGGTGFTPLVNSPEVAILGASKSKIVPQWNGREFVPRTALPLSLSYDHNAINGADAGLFFTDLIQNITNYGQD